MNPPKHTITVELPEPLRGALGHVAEAQHRTVHATIVSIVAAELDVELAPPRQRRPPATPEQINVRLPAMVHRRVRLEARDRNVTVGDIIVAIVSRRLGVRSPTRGSRHLTLVRTSGTPEHPPPSLGVGA